MQAVYENITFKSLDKIQFQWTFRSTLSMGQKMKQSYCIGLHDKEKLYWLWNLMRISNLMYERSEY